MKLPFPPIKRILLTALPLLFISACNNTTSNNASAGSANVKQSGAVSIKPAESTPLKTLFIDKYKIGTALNKQQILGEEGDTLTLVKREFNALTPENIMKWERINPTQDTYLFEAPDALVEFSVQNDMFLTGHTLVWHSQVPDWVFEHKDGTSLNRIELLDRMEIHINKVAGRYSNKINAWDVVNEALNEDGTLRESKWLNIIGDDFIEQAFIMAAKAAPKAKLYYNDYNLYKPEKRNGVVNLIKRLQEKGIKIDGVGMQGHYSLTHPELNDLEDSIKAFASLNVDVLITELDVSVLPFPDEKSRGADVSLDLALQKEFNPYPDGLPKEIEQQLAKRYKAIFDVFNRNHTSIKRVTFWGVHDAQTWRNDWPMKGRSDYPLLFDRASQQKPFVSILNQE